MSVLTTGQISTLTKSSHKNNLPYELTMHSMNGLHRVYYLMTGKLSNLPNLWTYAAADAAAAAEPQLTFQQL